MQTTISQASRNLSHWINQASYGRECIILTSRGRPKAVLLGMEEFESLLGLPSVSEAMPIERLRTEFRQALAEAGYETRQDILELVDDVKRELAEERTTYTAETDE